MWRVEDLKPAAVFDVQYEVFRLTVSFDDHVLGVGHYGGVITTWLLDSTEIRASLLQRYVGHTDNVVCLCIAPELDLMCSGSRDRLANVHDAHGLSMVGYTRFNCQNVADFNLCAYAPCHEELLGCEGKASHSLKTSIAWT